MSRRVMISDRKHVFDKETCKYGYEYTEREEGIFHMWGRDVDEGASYTVAVVELKDGRVELVDVSCVRFTEPV